MPEEGRDDDAMPDRLVERTKEFLGDVVMDLLRAPLEKVAKQFAGRIAQLLIGVTFVCAAIVFLMVGLIQILEQQFGPERQYLAYVIVGFVAMVLGAVTILYSPKDK